MPIGFFEHPDKPVKDLIEQAERYIKYNPFDSGIGFSQFADPEPTGILEVSIKQDRSNVESFVVYLAFVPVGGATQQEHSKEREAPRFERSITYAALNRLANLYQEDRVRIDEELKRREEPHEEQSAQTPVLKG